MESKRKARVLKPRTDVAIADRSVSMSNALARGAQGLSLSQKRIISLAMADTDSLPARDLMTGQIHGWTVRLLAHDYAETYEVDANTAYEQLKTGAHSLLKTLWRTVSMGRKGPSVTEGQWLSLAKYSKGEGRVDITFHPHIAPHLLALRKQFTTYKLKQAAALRSIYAWRLFECLQSWQSTGRWTPDIAEFHKAMEAPASCVKDFGQLKRRVIEPAVKELREKDGVRLEWEPVKAGRKVVGLDFKFSPDPQIKLDL
jgi:Protein involved in initiation of plasmid replication